MPGHVCYVLGCRDRVVLSARHRMFGLVSSCAGHNPIRHAYDRPLVPEIPPGAAPRGPGPGGARVPRVPVGGVPRSPVGAAVGVGDDAPF